jgi:hypothetical protein
MCFLDEAFASEDPARALTFARCESARLGLQTEHCSLEPSSRFTCIVQIG